jgi:hypothetical protein
MCGPLGPVWSFAPWCMYGPCPNIWPFGPWLGLVKEGLVWADLKVVGLAPLISISAPLCSALIVISSLCSLVASLRCAHSWLRSLSIDPNGAQLSLCSMLRTSAHSALRAAHIHYVHICSFTIRCAHCSLLLSYCVLDISLRSIISYSVLTPLC